MQDFAVIVVVAAERVANVADFVGNVDCDFFVEYVLVLVSPAHGYCVAVVVLEAGCCGGPVFAEGTAGCAGGAEEGDV